MARLLKGNATVTSSQVVDLTVADDLTVTDTLTVNGATVFNEASADVDFRIESDGNANAFFVEGSTGFVGIGTATFAGAGGGQSQGKVVNIIGESEDGNALAIQNDGNTKRYSLCLLDCS